MIKKVLIGAGIAVAIICIIWIITEIISVIPQKPPASPISSPAKQVFSQIYPNYTFRDTNVIKIALIPSHEQLAQEAGGWVIIPPGSGFRIDYNVPVIIEYINGKSFSRMPGRPAWDGVEPGNGIFRVRGNPNDSAIVIIKRNQY
ncbi:MAG: hypothetical protein WC394_03890 [Candidatus Omnitrophota bacterium]|jgi:hypothetical protein